MQLCKGSRVEVGREGQRRLGTKVQAPGEDYYNTTDGDISII